MTSGDRLDSQLWQATQKQLNELAGRVNELSVKLAEANDAIMRLTEETKGFAEESRAGHKRLEKRIDTLVSAIGQFSSAT